MIDRCANYARTWKITFNTKKSSVSKFGNNYHEDWEFQLNGEIIPKSNNMVYLGLSIGTCSNINDFMSEKMRKVERAFYSLYTIGCKPYRLRPKTIALFYKTMCQSILLYGLDVMPICVTKLKEINTRQSTLIKNAVGLNKFCRSTVLLKSLGIENVYNLSHKSTLRVNDQIKTNLTTFRLYNYLREFYKKYCPLKRIVLQKT